MIPRVLEPEAMDTADEAREYDAMDHSEVNARFVADFLAAHGSTRGGTILDVGTGTARIPIELCRGDPYAHLLGIDLAEHMLAIARRNVADAGLSGRIRLQKVDAKKLPFDDGSCEGVISNTIIHHIPEPAPVLADMARLVAPGGTLFCRDLARPATKDDLDRLVALHVSGEFDSARRFLPRRFMRP